MLNKIAKHNDPRQARPHASTTIARVLKRAQLTSLTQVARTKVTHKSRARQCLATAATAQTQKAATTPIDTGIDEPQAAQQSLGLQDFRTTHNLTNFLF